MAFNAYAGNVDEPFESWVAGLAESGSGIEVFEPREMLVILEEK